MTHPCNQCNFQATSARQLSRHKAVTHVKNPLKCVLCPFVTAYQTNLLRHRREVHGILGSKGNKSCKFCGFEADDNDTLILHQQQAHQDILKSARERFAREKKSARGTCIVNNEDVIENYNNNSMINNTINSVSNSSATNNVSNNLLNSNPVNDNLSLNSLINANKLNQNLSSNEEEEEEEEEENEVEEENEEDFWKEGFIDNPPSLMNYRFSDFSNYGTNFNTSLTSNFNSNFQFNDEKNDDEMNENNDSINNVYSPESSENGELGDNGFSKDSDNSILNLNKTNSLMNTTNNTNDSNLAKSSNQLAPTRIRRQYSCHDCGFRTVNPREFLYHRRDVHNQKVKIVECPYCVYACQYFQKLQRHMLLVHKLETSITPPVENKLAKKDSKKDQDEILNYSIKPVDNALNFSMESVDHALNYSIKSNENSFKEEEEKKIVEEKKEIEKKKEVDKKKEIKKSFEKSTRKCKYCSFQTDSFSKLEKHENSFHLEKRYQCPLCEIRFENLVWLQRHLSHMHQNNEQANQIIQILEMVVPKRKRLKVNNNTSNEQKNDQKNNQQKTNQQETSTIINIDKNSTKCSVCAYETKWFSELQKHMRVHTNEKPFNCNLCSFRTKWKGDLNRHIHKYHAKAILELNKSNEEKQAQSSSNKNEDNSSNEFENIDEEIEDVNEDIEEEINEEITEELNEELNEDVEEEIEEIEEREVQEEESSFNNFMMNSLNKYSLDKYSKLNENLIKVYKCSYCDFICNTASRFHVHFVQHLNTKPFMCSVCEHRSNWEWDVTKHIKMKSQKGDDHANATAVLVHDSGKRDYRKYDKYLILINKSDVESEVADPNANKNESLTGDTSNVANSSNNLYDSNLYDPESIVITPDISFSIGNEKIFCGNEKFNNFTEKSNLNNSSNFSPKPSKLFYCAYCNYTHRDSKSLVSHLSIHAGKKPFKCRLCGFSSNWREVLNRHVASRHSGNSSDIEQLFKYTVSKYICKIIDEKGQINPGPEITTQACLTNCLPNSYSPNNSFSNKKNLSKQNNLFMLNSILGNFKSNLNNSSSTINSSLINNHDKTPKASSKSNETPEILVKHGISGRISGFKGEFKCSKCPFRAEKAFHMDFHSKRHNQLPGADFKCPHCPYWVNAKKSLVKHVYLHKYENEINLQKF